ncbi:Clp1/GlmU family protein [Thiohalorhabdus sp.]|uniref:Clp1/GlmU family protein n=1 Tax=Thiohalorhabdus sp. TaxID=3094134 RepID=UPI002FC2A6B6
MTNPHQPLLAASCTPERRLVVPESWERAFGALVRQAPRRIVVLGATDRGKSTFCALLRRRLLAASHATALVDADIGQKDLGPPATVTLGLGDPSDPPAQRPEGHYFVGAVSPPGHLLPIVIGARRLAEAAGDRVTLVDTPGMIQGVGRTLIQFLLESLRPEVVVALESDDEAGAILAGAQASRQFRLRPPPGIAAKTPEQRGASRARGFREHFAGARRREWHLDCLGIQRSLLFSGAPADPGTHVYAEDTAEGRLVVGGPEHKEPGTQHLPAGFEPDLLCGVADGRGACRGLARLRRIDYPGRRLEVVTPVPPGVAAILQLGDLYVGPNGREEDRRRPRNL